jgi:hypothetical protein
MLQVRFEELEKDVSGGVQRIYEQLGIKGFEQSGIADYTSTKEVGGHTKNKHTELSPELKELVYQRWSRSFNEFGYDK